MVENLFAQRVGVGELFTGSFFVGGIIVLGLWALIDAARTTEKEWMAIGRGKGTWVLMIICTSLFCGPIGMIFSIDYLVMIRPELQRARMSSF